MSTITLRGLKPEVESGVRRRAQRQGKTLNRCMVEIVEACILGDTTGKPREYDDLDHLFGSMTAADARQIDAAVADSRAIDQELWS